MSAANNLASGLSGNRTDDEVDETVGFQLVQEEKPEEPKLEADEVVDETATCNKGGSESEESGDDDEALLARLQVWSLTHSLSQSRIVKVAFAKGLGASMPITTRRMVSLYL